MVTTGSFTSPKREADQPDESEDHSGDPQQVYREACAEENQDK
jgi:hypothetical protein